MKVIQVHTQYLPTHGGSSIRINKILEAGTKYPNYEQHILVLKKNILENIPKEEIINSV